MKARLPKGVLAHFWTYNLIPFLILGSGISFGLYYAVESIDEYKDHEKIDLFCEGYSFLDPELKKAILEENEGVIFKVETHVYSPHMREIAKMYAAYGEYADLLVLTEKDLTDMDKAIATRFLSMEGCSIPSSLTTYEFEGTPYAVKLFDKEDEGYNAHYALGDWLKFDEEFESLYLLLNARSQNMGSLNAKSKNDAGLHAFSTILERYIR